MNSHRHHLLKAALALALAVGLLAAAGTTAYAGNPGVTKYRQQGVRVIRVTTPGGFDWGDAVIGAAAGFGLAMLALGGGLLIAERRRASYASPR